MIWFGSVLQWHTPNLNLFDFALVFVSIFFGLIFNGLVRLVRFRCLFFVFATTPLIVFVYLYVLVKKSNKLIKIRLRGLQVTY